MSNPLQAYMTSPNATVSLPSKGKFYKNGTLAVPPHRELNVLPMSARDDLDLNNPSLLMNGSALMNVIKRCVPDVLNPWDLPLCDVEAIMLAVKLASAEKTYSVYIQCPECEKEGIIERDIQRMIDSMDDLDDEYFHTVNGVNIYMRPPTWDEYDLMRQQKFAHQKITSTMLSLAQMEGAGTTISSEKDAEIASKLSDSYVEIFKIRENMVITCVDKIVTPNNDIIVDKSCIAPFIQQLKSDDLRELNKILDSINFAGVSKIEEVQCSNVECNHEWSQIVDRYDPTNFFGLRS